MCPFDYRQRRRRWASASSGGLARYLVLRSRQRHGDDVIGDVRKVIEELRDGEEILRRVQTDDLVSLALYSRE
jgi:hypothetical protein